MRELQSPTNVRGTRIWTRTGVAYWTALFVGLVITMVAAPLPSAADTEEEIQRGFEKERWQTRYRFLLTETERLRSVVEYERELYADANRRNYRRGSKRHQHRDAIEEAKLELAEIEAQLATFEDDARMGGAERGWLTQVEIELEDEARRPAVTAGPGDEGRNPLYLNESDAND